MDIRVLQYFLTVAKEENITKAADLGMTQPPLSRQLKALEVEVGKQLFIRGSKKATLTEDGMLLRRRAEELVELMEKTKSELACSTVEMQIGFWKNFLHLLALSLKRKIFLLPIIAGL